MNSRILNLMLVTALTFSFNFVHGQITTSEVIVKETNGLNSVSKNLTLETATNNEAAYINFGPGIGYGFQVGKANDVNSGTGSNNFYIYDLLNNQPRFVIDDMTGNIGIGTTDPITKLDVYGGLTLNTTSNNDVAYINFGPGSGYGFQMGKAQDVNGGTGSNNFYIYDLLNNQPRFVIDDMTGNVGIGTTDPITKLDVYGGLTLNTTSNNDVAYINFGPGSGYGFQIGKAQDVNGGTGSNNFYIYDLLNNQPRFVIDDITGNVGIGTINPTAKLHVNGTIKAPATDWSDFVFDSDYDLASLQEVENHIEEFGHLKDIPSESEVMKEGVNLTEMDSKLLQKIEELTLYLINVNKRVTELEKENIELKEEVSLLKKE